MELEQERLLIERAQADPQAFAALYDEYFSQIFGYVIKRTADMAVAQDVTAEVFFKALRNINGFRWRGISFSDWLYRIAIHEIANVYSRNGHNRALTDELKRTYAIFDSNVERATEESQQRLRQEAVLMSIHPLVAALPPKYQEVISLRYFEKKQISEVARILGKREGTVKSLLHRGLEKLRQKIEETGATI
jgi:RNA polymerase sigma-70 factor, ECF subfamily